MRVCPLCGVIHAIGDNTLCPSYEMFQRVVELRQSINELRQVVRDFCFRLPVGDDERPLGCPACGVLVGMEHSTQCRIGAVLPGEKFGQEVSKPEGAKP